MWRKIVCVLLSCVFVAGFAFAQAVSDRENSRSANEGTNMTPEQVAQHFQQHLAKGILCGNQMQILLGEFASERAQNPEVKQFAQMMVKNHRDMVAKLDRLAPNSVNTETLGKRVLALQNQWKSELGTTPVTSETGGESRMSNPSDMTSEKMNEQNPMHKFAALEQKFLENVVALTEVELGQVDKSRFDRAYIDQQIGSHIIMLAKLKTLEPYASGDLKPLIEQAEKVTRAHLDQAKNICKQLESNEATAKRGSTTR